MISHAKHSDLDRSFFFLKCHCNRICSGEKEKIKLLKKCQITQDESSRWNSSRSDTQFCLAPEAIFFSLRQHSWTPLFCPAQSLQAEKNSLHTVLWKMSGFWKLFSFCIRTKPRLFKIFYEKEKNWALILYTGIKQTGKRCICKAERSRGKPETCFFLDKVRMLNRSLMLLVGSHLTRTLLGW